MQTCSKCHTIAPDEAEKCPGCGGALAECSDTAVALQTLQENNRVIYVRVAVNDDACPACRMVEGAYAKDAAPKLPIEGCSHPLGCRCHYQPVLDEVYP